MSELVIRRADTLASMPIVTVCKTRARFMILTLLGDGQILSPEYVLKIAKEFDVSETSLREAKMMLGVRTIREGLRNYPAKALGWGILEKVKSLSRVKL